MDLRLIELQLKNWRGIKQLELKFRGKDNIIAGTNNVGKTSVFDAFRWLLFDKDSQGRSQFPIKTLDADNNVIHKLDHSVTGRFEKRTDNGIKEIKLQKVYREKWTKKKGTTEQEFQGHTTDYFLNETPVKKSEYEEFVDTLIKENLFKLITDPLHFSGLHWEDQREIIFQLVEQPTAEEITETAGINLELGDRNIEDYKKELKSKMNKVNGKLQEIPVRIDTHMDDLPGEIEEDRESLKSEKKSLQKSIETLQEQINEKQQANIKTEIKSNINKLQTKRDTIQQRLRNEINEDISETENEIRKRKNFASTLQDNIKQAERQLENMKAEKEELIEEYYEWQDKEFPKDQTTCPECGQELPEGQIDEHRTEFNKKKSDKLEAIKSTGKELTEDIEDKAEKIESMKDDLEKRQDNLPELEAELRKLEDYKQEIANHTLPEFDDIKEQLEEEQKKLKTMPDQPEGIGELEEEKAELQQELEPVIEKLSLIDYREKIQGKIEKLNEKEKTLTKKYEELERELYETEQFVETKVRLMEADINEKFAGEVKVKLFEKQVNGAIVPTCEATRGGVPYSGLNTGQQFQAGMEIIETLCRHYGIRAPVFIDNRERVAELPAIDSQTIHLVMSPSYKELELIPVENTGAADTFVEEEADTMQQEKLFS